MSYKPGAGGQGRINNSTDVALNSLDDGDVLIYSAAQQSWQNKQSVVNVENSVEMLLDRISGLERQFAGTTPVPTASPDITSVNVAWEPIYNSVAYWLYNGATKVGETTDTTYVFTGLTAATAYVLGVRSVATDGSQSAIGTVNVTTDILAPTQTISLMWSTSGDRTNPSPLNGATAITTNDRIFTSPDSANIQSVSFVTDGATGSPYTEINPPYDYKGSATTAPFAANPNTLTAGAHTITATVTFKDSTPQEVINASFTIAGAPGVNTAALRWSGNEDRSNPLALAGATGIATDDFVFVTATDITKVASVTFTLDSVAITPTQTVAPFDLRGRTGSIPNPLNLAAGSHTLSAIVTFNDGTTTQNLSATFNVYDPSTGTGSGGDTSYWQSNPQYAVTHAYQLDPSLRKWAGNRPGVALTTWTGPVWDSSSDSPLYRNPEANGGYRLEAGTYRNYIFTRKVRPVSSSVKFINCRFQANGFAYPADIGVKYRCGTSDAAVLTKDYSPTFIDCEMYGGQDASFVGGGTLTRCLMLEGDDLVKLRPERLTLIECVLDGPKRKAADSHSDAIQSTTSSGSTTVHLLTLTRTWVNVYNRRTKDHHNSCLQFGGYGSGSSGLTGTATGCYFQGGNTTINTSAGGGGGMTFRDCRISRKWRGLNSKGDYGSPGFSSSSTDTRIKHVSNVWAENPTEVIITTMLTRLDP